MIDARWDAAAHVWVATSDTVPGVAVEATTCEDVLGAIEDVLPDLLRANGVEWGEGTVSVVFDTRVKTVRLPQHRQVRPLASASDTPVTVGFHKHKTDAPQERQ